MPNWQDPVLIASQYQSFVILQHALAGVWFWEYFSNLHYDWQLVRRAKITWTPWMYIMCRIFGLGAMITIITGFDLQVEINCRAWLVFVYFFVYGATFLASSLIGIRVVAVWNRNIFVIVFVAMTLLAFAGTFLHGLIVARAEWSDAAGTCAVGATTQNLPNAVAGLVVDTTLLGMMLVGLLRWREARNYGVWQVLWKQGLLWVLLATIAEVPTVVFISLNLNDPMNLMMLTPEFMILLIGSTRMYRGLTNFFSADHSSPSGLTNSGISDSHLRRGRSTRDNKNVNVNDSGLISMVPLSEVSIQSREALDGKDVHFELEGKDEDVREVHKVSV